MKQTLLCHYKSIKFQIIFPSTEVFNEKISASFKIPMQIRLKLLLQISSTKQTNHRRIRENNRIIHPEKNAIRNCCYLPVCGWNWKEHWNWREKENRTRCLRELWPLITCDGEKPWIKTNTRKGKITAKNWNAEFVMCAFESLTDRWWRRWMNFERKNDHNKQSMPAMLRTSRNFHFPKCPWFWL